MDKTGSVIFALGPVKITDTVVTTWVIMVLLALAAWLMTRRLKIQAGRVQTVLEGVITLIHGWVSAVAHQYTDRIFPFVATLWLYLVFANLAGLIPGVHSPTRDLSATSALALTVFFSVHWFGVTAQGIWLYLKHYVKPSPILLPFHIISEITRTVALAVRLFGNIMSLEMAALLVLLVAGFLVPVPLLMLHIIEALVQAYIFGMLALIYITGGLQSRQRKQNKQGESYA